MMIVMMIMSRGGKKFIRIIKFIKKIHKSRKSDYAALILFLSVGLSCNCS